MPVDPVLPVFFYPCFSDSGYTIHSVSDVKQQDKS